MNEQITLELNSEENIAKKELHEIILEMAKKWDCSTELFRLDENRTNGKLNGYSLYFDGSLVLKSNLTFDTLSTGKTFVEKCSITYSNAKELSTPKNFIKCTYSDAITAYKATLFIVDLFIDEYEPNEHFGCCSKYIECSDAMKCLNKDLIRSKACYYKKNLKEKRIFYGKNKNI